MNFLALVLSYNPNVIDIGVIYALTEIPTTKVCRKTVESIQTLTEIPITEVCRKTVESVFI